MSLSFFNLSFQDPHSLLDRLIGLLATLLNLTASSFRPSSPHSSLLVFTHSESGPFYKPLYAKIIKLTRYTPSLLFSTTRGFTKEPLVVLKTSLSRSNPAGIDLLLDFLSLQKVYAS